MEREKRKSFRERKGEQEDLQKIHSVLFSILTGSNVPKVIIRDLLDDGVVVREFQKILRHKGVDSNSNYEMDEFVGDSLVNLIIAKEVSSLPQVKRLKAHSRVKIATRIKHTIQSNKDLAKVARKYKIIDLVKFGEERVDIKVEGDVLEAFIGCLFRVIEMKRMESSAYIICSLVVKFLLSESLENIPSSEEEMYEKFSDSFTIYKENFADYYKLGQPKDWSEVKTSIVDGAKIYSTVIYDIKRKGDTYVIDKTSVLGRGISEDATSSKNKAATMAMKGLRERNIQGKKGT